MLVSEELHDVPLPDGGTIVADVSYGTGMVITRRDRRGSELARISRDYPFAGFGGGGWLLSPSKRMAILGYFSGQAEEAFLLLDLSSDGLRLLAAPDYRSGRCGSYAFSPEEDTLVLVLPRSSSWWQSWEDDWLEDAEDGTPVVPFGGLIVCTTSSGRLHDVEIELAPNVDTIVDPETYDPDLDPRLSAEGLLTLRFPWGDAAVDLSGEPKRVRVTQP